MSMYDTTTGGLDNAGLVDTPERDRQDVERTREALDDVGTPAPGTVRRVGRSMRRRPAPVTGVALLLAGAAATVVLLRRRAAAKRTGWARMLPRR